MAVIKTKGFTLRPYRKGDEPSLAKNINDRTIHRNTLHIPYPYTKKDAVVWVNKTLKESAKKQPSEVSFAIDKNGEVIGGVGLSNIKGHRAEIGYWLGKDYRRNGVMTKAVKLTTNFGFKNLKLKRIYAHVFPHNKASMKVLLKNNYQKEGVLRKYTKKDKRIFDAHLFAKVR